MANGWPAWAITAEGGVAGRRQDGEDRRAAKQERGFVDGGTAGADPEYAAQDHAANEYLAAVLVAEEVRACALGPLLLRGSIDGAAAVFFFQAKGSAEGVDENWAS